MFRYHKYCVVDVSGELRWRADGELYLLDAADESPAAAEATAILLSDSGLLAFIREQVLPQCGGEAIMARISGSVGLDNGVVQLAGVTQARLQAGSQGFHYSAVSDE